MVVEAVAAAASKFITNWMSNKAEIVSQNGHIPWTWKNYPQKNRPLA